MARGEGERFGGIDDGRDDGRGVFLFERYLGADIAGQTDSRQAGQTKEVQKRSAKRGATRALLGLGVASWAYI